MFSISYVVRHICSSIVACHHCPCCIHFIICWLDMTYQQGSSSARQNYVQFRHTCWAAAFNAAVTYLLSAHLHFWNTLSLFQIVILISRMSCNRTLDTWHLSSHGNLMASVWSQTKPPHVFAFQMVFFCALASVKGLQLLRSMLFVCRAAQNGFLCPMKHVV